MLVIARREECCLGSILSELEKGFKERIHDIEPLSLRFPSCPLAQTIGPLQVVEQSCDLASFASPYVLAHDATVHSSASRVVPAPSLPWFPGQFLLARRDARIVAATNPPESLTAASDAPRPQVARWWAYCLGAAVETSVRH